MARTFKLETVTPDGMFSVRDIVFLDVPAEKGRLTVLAGHEPMICSLAPGAVRIREQGTDIEERWEIGRGTLGVSREAATLLVRDIRPVSTPNSR